MIVLVDGKVKSYMSKLRSDWKYYLQTLWGIDSKLTIHSYRSTVLYHHLGGVVPRNRVYELLDMFYKEKIKFIPKEKRTKFNEYFKKAFEVEIGWKL